MGEPVLKLIIPGAPVPKGRPRFRVFRKFVSVYTPAATLKYEKLVASVGKKALEDAGFKPLIGAVKMDVKVFLECPKSAHRVRNPRPAELCVVRPDIDNFLKVYLDGLNEVMWKDDNQVVQVNVEKWRSAQLDQPRAEILIWSLADEWASPKI